MKRSYMVRRYRDTGPDLKTVLDVLARDRHMCVRDSVPIRGDRGTDWVIHHRRPRAMGGSRLPDTNEPQNLLSLCAACHEYVESHRAEALDNGWLVPQSGNPSLVSVLVEHGRRWVFLDPLGYYVDSPVVAQ